jgi:tRNA (guanine37-N1)-methyltransferase
VRKLKELLKDKLTEEELKLVKSSFDIVGSREKAVAIIEIPKELEEKKGLIAEALMKLNKNVKSVLRKISGRRGNLRLREFELVAGDPNTEVLHKENGYILKLDPQKVYFSPREATERMRIAKQVKAGEKVLVMFSGVGPYCIAIAKFQPLVEKVYGIEINPIAHKYAEENVRINKLSHKIVLIEGDVRDVYKNFKNFFDRIVMPLPLGGEEFLELAVYCLKKGGYIHFYSWGLEEDPYVKGMKIIEKFVKAYKIIGKRLVLPYAPRKWKVCIDLQVLNDEK